MNNYQETMFVQQPFEIELTPYQEVKTIKTSILFKLFFSFGIILGLIISSPLIFCGVGILFSILGGDMLGVIAGGMALLYVIYLTFKKIKKIFNS